MLETSMNLTQNRMKGQYQLTIVKISACILFLHLYTIILPSKSSIKRFELVRARFSFYGCCLSKEIDELTILRLSIVRFSYVKSRV